MYDTYRLGCVSTAKRRVEEKARRESAELSYVSAKLTRYLVSTTLA